MPESRGPCLDARRNLGEKTHAMIEAPSVAARAASCAQQLVSKIAVTVFDIHEPETGLACQDGRGHEIVDQPRQLVVAEDRFV